MTTQKRRGPFYYEERRVDRSAADVITAIDAAPIHTLDDLLTVLDTKKPGDTVTITVLRAGREQQVRVTLDSDG